MTRTWCIGARSLAGSQGPDIAAGIFAPNSQGEEIVPGRPASSLRLIAVAAGSTVLAMGPLGEERVMAFFVVAPAELGA